MLIRKYAEKRYFHIVLILILVILAYSNSFLVPFLFDDIQNIVDNPLIKSPDLIIDSSVYCSQNINIVEQESLCHSFKTRLIGYYSFALNYKIHDLNVFGYHAFNLLIHVINGLLLYFFVLYTLNTTVLKQSKVNNITFIALSTTLLFILHPIQTQAVTYIVQRFTSLATTFYLFSLVMYVKWRITNINSKLKVIFYFTSIVSAVLSMKTKEIAFTLPFIITMYEFFFLEGKVRSRLLFLLPFYIALLIIPLSIIEVNKPIENLISEINESTRIMTSMSRWDYLYTQFRVILTYIRLVFLPVGQNLDYDYPISKSFFDIEVFFSFLVLFIIFLYAVYLLFRSRHENKFLRVISFGIFWFFITLSVESSIIPIADVIFEHRLYLPSVGIFVAIVFAVFFFINKGENRNQIVFMTAIILFVLSILLGSITYARNITWKDEIRLWNDVVVKSPKKARGYNNLGFAYEKKGFYYEALENYNKAIIINPDFDDAYYNRANAYSKIGLYDNAIYNYTKAILINPSYVQAYNNRGAVYSLKGEIDKAIEDFSQSIYINPMFSEAYYNRALSYLDKGSVVISDFQIACSLGHNRSCEALRKKYLKN